MALQEKRNFKILIGKEFHYRTLYGYRNGGHRYIDTLGHDISAFKKVVNQKQKKDICKLDGKYFNNITQYKNTTTGSFSFFGFNGEYNEIMDKVNEYREILKFPNTSGLGFMSGVYGVKKPSTKEYPSLIDFDSISYVPEILSYKQAANKYQMTLSSLWKNRVTTFSGSALGNMLHKQETMYLNPYDYKFYSIKDNSLVATHAPEHYWSQINANDEGTNVSPFKYMKERKRALANFKYYGGRLMLSKYTENIEKRNVYFQGILPNCEILSAEPFIYDESNEDMIRLILQNCMSDFYDGNDDLVFTIANKQYKLDLENEAFINVESNTILDCIMVNNDKGQLDYIISFEEYKSKLRYLYKLDNTDEPIIQKVVDYFSNKRTDRDECLKEQYTTLDVRDSILSKYFRMLRYDGVINTSDGYMYNQCGTVENYKASKYGQSYTDYNVSAFPYWSYSSIDPNSSQFIPTRYELLSFLPNRIYNINVSYYTNSNGNSFDEYMNINALSNPTFRNGYAKTEWNVIYNNPTWQFRKIYSITKDPMVGDSEGADHSNIGEIKLIDDGEYIGERIFIYKDNSVSIQTQDTNKILDRVIEDKDVLFNIFNIVTNLNNIDRTELDRKLANNEPISAHLYMVDIDYKLASNNEIYDEFTIQPIFVIDGLYCTNKVYIQQFVRQLVKYYPTDEEIETLEDFNVDEQGRKYIIKDELSTKYDDGTYTAGDYEIGEIDNVKEYIKFRLNKRILKRYAKLRLYIQELKNTTDSFLIKYRDENNNIKVMLHKEDYLTFKQKTDDISINLVKCLPYVYLYNREHILLPFKASYYDPNGLFGFSSAGLLISGLVNIFSKKAAKKIREKLMQSGFGLLQRDGKLGEYDEKTHTFTANNPAYAEYYNSYNKKVNMYFRNLYSYYVKEYDALANPSYQDLEYKVDNVKKRKRLSKRFTDSKNPFYIQPPFKIEEKNEDDYTDYMKSTKANMFSVCLTSRFSFMIYLNRTFRKTKLLAKMGYIYLDYFYKQYNGEYNQWITVPLYPPDRIQYTEKLCKIRFMKSSYDIEVEGNKAMFYCVFSWNNNTLTFYNKPKKEKIVFDISTYCPKYKTWYFNDKSYNEFTKQQLGQFIKQNRYISFFDITDSDIAFKQTEDIVKNSSQYIPDDKYIKYADGYKYSVTNPFYNTSLVIKYNSNGQEYNKRIPFYWNKNDKEWIGFYTPNELDLGKYTFDDTLASTIKNNLIVQKRNVVEYLIKVFSSKTISELKDIYKKLYNKDIDITETIDDNIFDLNGLLDTFNTNNDIDMDIFNKEDNVSVLVKQNQYGLPTIASDIQLDIIQSKDSGNNRTTINGRTYEGPKGIVGGYNASNAVYKSGNYYLSDNYYFGYAKKHGGYMRKDLSSVCFLESMSLCDSWNNSALIDISFTDNINESKTKKEVALQIIGDWIQDDVLPSSKIISIDEFKHYFIENIKQSLKEVFSDYEIYQLGFINFLVSNNVSSSDTTPTIFIDNIYKQDFCFVKKQDIQNDIFDMHNVLLPVPIDAFKRMPYYCKKFIVEYYGVIESQCLQPMIYASEEANIKTVILQVSNAIIIFVIALIIIVFSLGEATPLAVALIIATIVLMTVAFIFQIASIVIPNNRLSKLFADISKGFSIASSVTGAMASFANLAQTGMTSLTTLQIASLCAQSTSLVVSIVNDNLQKKIAELENKKIDEYNQKVLEYNKEMDELEKFYEDNEFNFGYLEVKPLDIDFQENTMYDKRLGLDIETLDSTTSLYEMVDSYYDAIL